MKKLGGLFNINFHTHRIGKHRAFVIHGRLPGREDSAFGKARHFIRTMRALDKKSPDKPIVIIIRSGGGDTISTLILHDVLSHELHAPIITATNFAASGAAILFVYTEKGSRYLLGEDARLLLHNSKSAVGRKKNGPWINWFLFIKRIREYLQDRKEEREIKRAIDCMLAKIIYSATGGNKTMLARMGDWSDEENEEEIMHGITLLLERDQHFTAREAIACGLADAIINKDELKKLIQEVC